MTIEENIAVELINKDESTGSSLPMEDVESRLLRASKFHLNSFCWQDISVWGKQKEVQGLWRRTKYREFQIVPKVSGYVPHGSLMAIMGPSGSGKTTLLTAISRRLREGVHGDVYVNGQIVDIVQMMTLSGFVPQDDITIQNLTVHEHLRIMAVLKMDRSTSKFHRTKKILSTMEEIGITNLASSYLSNLSGGESRKLSIAVQLLTDPLLLFCDEPTTGLDSANASAVVKMLKKFSSGGKIVICSIHQPAALIYELFDQVLLLASGGRIAYLGPVLEATNHFQNLGFKCPPDYNIAEFLINTISLSDFNADERIETICEYYFTSRIKEELEKKIKLSNNYIPEILPKTSKNKKNSLSTYFTINKPTLLTQTFVLVQRSCLNLRKDYSKISAHMLSLVFLSAMISGLFGQITLCSENSFQNIRGALSTVVVSTFYESAYYQFNTLVSERPFIMREINNGLYRIEAYCIAKLLGKLIVSVSLSTILVLILHLAMRAYTHLSFWNLVLPLTIISVLATSYGCMLSSAFNDLNVLFVVATGYEMPAYLLSGITVNLNSLPIIISYLRYISLFYYFVEYIFVLEWEKAFSQHIQCKEKGVYTNEPAAALELLKESGYDVYTYQKNIWILISISILFFIITYIFLHKKSKERVPY